MRIGVEPPEGEPIPWPLDVMLRAREIALALKYRWPWLPNPDTDGVPHPQRLALESEADILGYGGAAGGGKTDLACGMTITRHRKVMILRRVGTELTGIEDRLEELIGSKDGYNGSKKIWKRTRPDGVRQQIEFASLPTLGDEKGYQGRPHDLIVFDEAANFLEAQVRFLLGWLRTTVKGQRCRALMCFNPPTSAEGQWIIAYFGPWLDPRHANPAKPGELRWFATIKGKDVEVRDGERFVIGEDDQPVYEFNPKDYRGDKAVLIVKPRSRTFIPSKVTDNPHLMGTDYMAELQALPEPLRSQMLNGDFQAGMQDDVWQVIPTAWVDAAMKRWEAWGAENPAKKPGPMDSIGLDIARGGPDETIIARRHGSWFDEPLTYQGQETPDGNYVMGLVLQARRDLAPIHLDVIGVGSSPYDLLRNAQVQVRGVDVRNAAPGTDRSGMLGFFNLRSELLWRMREALDPEQGRGLMLPPNSRLRADLCAPTWKPQGTKIKVESKDDIKERIGRSPDYGDAYVLALIDTMRMAALPGVRSGSARREHDPYA